MIVGKQKAHSMPILCRVPAVGKDRALGIYCLCRVPLGPHTAKAVHVPSTRASRAAAIRAADGC